jgi:flavin prenyltransferase
LPKALPIVVGVSGASGAPIALAVLRGLHAAHVPVSLVISHGAEAVLKEECGMQPSDLERYARRTFADDDLGAPIASGSNLTRGMVIVPCSSNTLARVALGLGDSLLTRAAQVHLKEHRPLVVVPRETPLSSLLLRHMITLAELGVVVLIASPGYYTRPQSVEEMTNFVAGRVLDQWGLPHRLYPRWKAGES